MAARSVNTPHDKMVGGFKICIFIYTTFKLCIFMS